MGKNKIEIINKNYFFGEKNEDTEIKEKNSHNEELAKLNTIDEEILKIDQMLSMIKSKLDRKKIFLTYKDIFEIDKHKNKILIKYEKEGFPEIDFMSKEYSQTQ
jgi:hypothetical protein